MFLIIKIEDRTFNLDISDFDELAKKRLTEIFENNILRLKDLLELYIKEITDPLNSKNELNSALKKMIDKLDV